MALYVEPNYRTKKQLREAVKAGCEVTVFQPGPFGTDTIPDGTHSAEGPHYPAAHSWYARVTVKAGRVVKVA